MADLPPPTPFMQPASRSAVRIHFFSPWAGMIQDAGEYLQNLPVRDLTPKVSNPSNADLMKMARLDCDWDGECLRAFTQMTHPHLVFRPAKIVGAEGLVDLAQTTFPKDETPWFFITGQRPGMIHEGIGRFLDIFSRQGRVLYWAFDDASRNMKCFSSVAPHLSILIHDESPLSQEGQDYLSPRCKAIHHSWNANMIPFIHPFDENPENQIVFLGSRLGLTPARQKQVEALQQHFKDRFVAILDHSLPVNQRGSFSRYKVHLCPEGRMFNTATMNQTHTDRPFWSGCLGQVPVVEDSQWGGRLEDLSRKGLILRYPHSHIPSLIQACEEALAMDGGRRRKIYEYFNQNETVGPFAAQAMSECLNG